MTTALAPDEILLEIRVPPQGRGWGFAEVVRRAGDFALAGVVALVDRASPSGPCDRARLVGFGVGDRPVRFTAAEEILTSRDPSAALTLAVSFTRSDRKSCSSSGWSYRASCRSLNASKVAWAMLRRDGAVKSTP
jgi:CO/xanthine dehydrogenase FAD-binding subunit